MVKMIDYSVPLPLRTAWQKTQEFWQVQKTKAIIKQATIMPGNENGVMEIEQMLSPWSWGQNYLMEFSSIDENTTSVHVKVWLNFGGGLQWTKANTILKDWARVVGSPYQNIAKSGIAVGAVVVTITIIVIIALFAYINSRLFLFRP